VRVGSVAVSLSDLTVFAVDEELRLLILSNVSTGLDGFSLRVVFGCHAGIALAAHGPLIAAPDDVLVLSLAHGSLRV